MAEKKNDRYDDDHRYDIDDSYDNFAFMIRQISRFNDQYRSFTTGKTYRNLLGKTATGLLRDVAADTRDLSPEERIRHKFSLEVFSAFCMYFCVKKIREKFRNVDQTLAGDVVNTVYSRVLNRIKRDLESKGECEFVRNLIRNSAGNAFIDLLRKEGKFVPLDDGSTEDEDEDLKGISPRIRRILIDGGAEAMANERRLSALIRALAQAGEQGILDRRELLSICHYYGLGAGFEKLGNHEIAQKLNCSDATATRVRSGGIRKLGKYILDTPELREEIL